PEGESRRQLRVRLGEACANAGRGSDAAQAFLAALPGASGPESLELRRRAAEQLLRSGRTDAGLQAVRDVLAGVGLRLPSTPRRALLSFLLRRTQLAVRGIGFRERAPEEIRPGDLTRAHVCWSVTSGLGMVDNIRANYFQTLHLLMAL